MLHLMKGSDIEGVGVGLFIFWVGELYWVLPMVGAVSFMGVFSSVWSECLAGNVMMTMVRRSVSKVFKVAHGRGDIGMGGFKKFWEIWVFVFFSLVLSECLPCGTQITFLVYPVFVFAVGGCCALAVSSFFTSPVSYLASFVPAGVPLAVVPLYIPLSIISSVLRPLVLVVRLSMAAILTVTLEGIFQYWSVSVGDWVLLQGSPLVESCPVWSFMVNLVGIWSENMGMLGLISTGACGILGLEKLFYMLFQVGLLAGLVLIFQRDHTPANYFAENHLQETWSSPERWSLW